MAGNSSRVSTGYDTQGQACYSTSRSSTGLHFGDSKMSYPILPADTPGTVGFNDLSSAEAGVCSLPNYKNYQSPSSSSAWSIISSVCHEIDKYPELTGAGAILSLPGSLPILVRDSDHATGLRTYVEITLKINTSLPPVERTWWQRWNGVILNCGGAVVSWGGVVVSAGAAVPTAGTSTALMVVSYGSAVATTAQCGLAVAKETSDDFAEFIQTEDGQIINTLDIALDIVSLAGVAGGINALKSGGKILTTSKYAAHLNKVPKGKLIKHLKRLEKAEADISYFKTAVNQLVKSGKVANPAKRTLSNNLLKRSLPYITNTLKKEKIAALADGISSSMAVISSSYGGVGSLGSGVVKYSIKILQESVFK